MEKVNLALESVNNLKAISQSLVENFEEQLDVCFIVVTIPFPIFLKEKLRGFAFKTTQ